MRKYKIGQKVTFVYDEFDGHGSKEGIITEVYDDHVIAEIDGNNYWIDEDTEYQFR